jgi:hypothetical protein
VLGWRFESGMSEMDSRRPGWGSSRLFTASSLGSSFRRGDGAAGVSVWDRIVGSFSGFPAASGPNNSAYCSDQVISNCRLLNLRN